MLQKGSYKWSMYSLVLMALLGVVFSSDAKAGCEGIDPITSVEDFCDVRCKDMSSIDISDRPNLPARLTFNQGTIWPGPAQMPAGCDPNVIMTNGMNPGLGVRALHQQGITGTGVNVAIIDQAMYLDHPEFAGKITTYYDLAAGEQSSMHGPAVTSLLVGTNCGTAPGARVYYCAVRSWVYEVDYAQALNWIVQQNESLPDSEKIRVVSVSAAPGVAGILSEPGEPTWVEAYAQAQAAGILVLDCSSERGFIGRCWYDVNDPENVAKCTPGRRPGESWFDPADILTPASLRTTAEEAFQGDHSYIYWSSAGTSWTRPYCAGVLAMGWQIRPELTKEQMIDLLFQTAYVNPDGAKIINPPAFISSLNSDKPVIGIDTTEIDFYAVTGEGNPGHQILSISNIGFGTLNWVLDYDCNWLNVEPNSGSSIGFSDVNEVTITVTDISVIPRSCELVISDPCATNSPQTVTVNLYLSTPYDGINHVPSEYETIRAAINDSNEGDIVVIEPGTYTGAGNKDLDFNGKAITVRSTDPNNPCIVASTIIDCNGSESEPHRGFHFHSNEDANSVLNGITITGGYAAYGGAIYCDNSSPTVLNCALVDNSAAYGGGMRNSNSSATVVNCIFVGNSAVNWGGGMTNRDCTSSLTVINCTFTNNLASWGAGMRNYTSSTTVINCIFSNNSAQGWEGGGMSNRVAANPTVINCTFSVNSSTLRGGGIYSDDDSSSTITNCILWENRAAGGTDESAQINNDGPTPVINYSCIQGWTGGLGGTGNIGVNPLFADGANGDYHLRSQVGRWNPDTQSWVIDGSTSASIDAGEPASDWTAELWPHGKRINMGAYGGTPQASMSLSTVGNKADLNNSDLVDYADLNALVNKWLCQATLLPEDLDRDGIVNSTDFAIFANEWLWEE